MEAGTWRVKLSRCRHQLRIHLLQMWFDCASQRAYKSARFGKHPSYPLEICHDLANSTHGKRGARRASIRERTDCAAILTSFRAGPNFAAAVATPGANRWRSSKHETWSSDL